LCSVASKLAKRAKLRKNAKFYADQIHFLKYKKYSPNQAIDRKLFVPSFSSLNSFHYSQSSITGLSSIVIISDRKKERKKKKKNLRKKERKKEERKRPAHL
jgi:hypothetical protein